MNDLFGYESGDELLKRVAEILAGCFLNPLAVGRMELTVCGTYEERRYGSGEAA